MCHLSLFIQIFNFYSISEWSHRVQFICFTVFYCNSSCIFFLHPRLLSDRYFTDFFFIKVVIDVMLISIELF